MKIGDLSGLGSNSIFKSENIVQKKPASNLFENLINNVKESQNESVELTKKFVSGENVEIHEVMIACEKAKTDLQLLMEIRNKALDMYKELTRISI